MMVMGSTDEKARIIFSLSCLFIVVLAVTIAHIELLSNRLLPQKTSHGGTKTRRKWEAVLRTLSVDSGFMVVYTYL
jgi:hypothetical protein